MLNLKAVLFASVFLLLLSGCISQQDPNLSMKNKPKKVDYLIETKDINNIKKLEVSNNLIQVLPVISISGVQVLLDEEMIDEKPMLFRNEKCIFQGLASADLTTKRVKVKIDKATCRTSYDHKVNYMVNGWILGEDENFGLKASKEILNKKMEDDDEAPNPKEKTVLKVMQGEYAYVSLDMVKQIETILIKKQMELKPTNVKNSPKENQKTRLMKIQ